MADSAIERSLILARAARLLEGPALSDKLAELEASLQHMRQAQLRQTPEPPDVVAEPLIELDVNGYITSWNRAAEALFGYSQSEAVGQHVLNLGTDDDETADVTGRFADGASGELRVRRRKKDGELIWVHLALTLRRDSDANPAGMLVQVAPMAPRLSAEEQRQLHARIIENSDQGVMITDAAERIVSVNGAFSRITGYTAGDALGQTPDLLRSGAHDADFRARVRAAMQGVGAWRGEIIGRRKNGELFPQSVTISVVRNDAGAITHTFSLFSDISVHKDAEARMQRMVNYDVVTGLPNRTLFNHLVDQTLHEARRTESYGAVMVLELGRLAAISDTLGHEVASDLLCEIGRQLRAALRDADILARIDGGKLAVALSHIEKREHAGLVAQKLLAALSEPLLAAGHSLRVSADIGIAVYPEDCMDTASLIRFADVAMAKAQELGGSSFLYYRDEMDQRAKEQLRLETELRGALAHGQLELHYQPKVGLDSGRIVGAEALLRWRHPERGMISPGVFIPLAEETGLIVDIGNWVLGEACRQIRAWHDAGLVMPTIAINLSARQFDLGLPARIEAVLAHHGVEPAMLMLEITEGLLVRDSEQVITIMNQLVAQGLALALDDFGTGYSSLAYLKKFPISTLKIDRAFVVGLPDEENDCAIARAIVTMAQQLSQKIVAEGVETQEQMEFLRALGCDELQGWLFSPAVPAADFARMLSDGRRLALNAS